jgi:hypothetical protein
VFPQANESGSAVLDKPEEAPEAAALPLAADAAPAAAAPPARVLPTFYEAMSFGGYAPETVRTRSVI